MYEKLRAWRRSRADAEGVPVYVVLNNRQLASIARLRPSTLGELQTIEGIGTKKAERFGRELLRVVGPRVEPPGRGPGEPEMEQR
jgi:ATP-dependent DNA helicase RecQ